MISSITHKAPVLQEALFENVKPKKMAQFVERLLESGAPPHFESELAYKRFFKAVDNLKNEATLAKTIAFMKQFRSIPDDLTTIAHQVEFYAGDTCIFSCSKALVKDIEYFNNMFHFTPSENGMHQVEPELSVDAIQALKKLLYREKLDNIPPATLRELHEYVSMLEDAKGLELIENQIISHFLDENNAFEPDYFSNNPHPFIAAFFKKKGIQYRRLNNRYEISLSDFITLFQQDSELSQFIIKKISRLNADTSDLLSLHLIKNRYRKYIKYIEITIKSDNDVQLASILEERFQNAQIDFTRRNLLGAHPCREEAIEYFKEALKHDPNSVVAHERLGDCLRLQGKYAEAIPHLEKAIAIDPNSAFARISLGECLRLQGKYAEAILHLEKAIVIAPNSAFALANLGVCLGLQGKYAEAIPHLEKAIEINPNSDFALANLGCCMLQQQNLDAAISYFNQALAINPNHVLARTELDKCVQSKK